MQSNRSEAQPGRGLTLWERINSDPRYLLGKQAIRARYGLPLDFDIQTNRHRWMEWLGAEESATRERAQRGQAFLNDVYALFRKFQVPEAWYSDFIADIAGRS
jgi:hypothetical protein